jgi:hypothetical protein
VALFFNGLPLGVVWGLVFSYLEGRRVSEILGAGLSTSYIVASGVVKSVGAWVLAQGVSESWMPAVTGSLFVPTFGLAVWGLNSLPMPTEQDVRSRTQREPMNGPQRSAFVRRFLAGLAALTALYMLLTAYRDFRDNFAAELWAALGYADDASVFALSELPIALVVLVGLALVYRITDNRRALLVIHGMMGLGTLLIALATALFDLGLLSGFQWMLAIGLGLYLGYVPYGCVLFDRLIATTRTVGTAVFMIYVTDAFGYVGSIGVLTVKNFFALDVSWLAFFRGFSYLTGWICTGAFAFSAWYFARVTRTGRVAT